MKGGRKVLTVQPHIWRGEQSPGLQEMGFWGGPECMKRRREGRWHKDQHCHAAGKMWSGWCWFKDTRENHARKAALGERLMRLEVFSLKQI